MTTAAFIFRLELEQTLLMLIYQKFVIAIGLSGCLVCCREADKSVRLGEYRGSKDGIIEILDLKQDGTFEHDVFKGSEKTLSEGGRYSISPDTVHLTKFTQIYNPIDRSMNSSGSVFGSYTFTYIGYEKFSELKDDVEEEYSLKNP